MYGYHFPKRSPAPARLLIWACLSEIIDGVTGLIMLPFGRYGTCFSLTAAANILRWQLKNRKMTQNTPNTVQK